MCDYTLRVNVPSHNIWPPPAPSNETDAERQLRIQEESMAREISDAIDRAIISDRQEMLEQKPNTKILLLGELLAFSWKNNNLMIPLMYVQDKLNPESLPY